MNYNQNLSENQIVYNFLKSEILGYKLYRIRKIEKNLDDFEHLLELLEGRGYLNYVKDYVRTGFLVLAVLLSLFFLYLAVDPAFLGLEHSMNRYVQIWALGSFSILLVVILLLVDKLKTHRHVYNLTKKFGDIKYLLEEYKNEQILRYEQLADYIASKQNSSQSGS